MKVNTKWLLITKEKCPLDQWNRRFRVFQTRFGCFVDNQKLLSLTSIEQWMAKTRVSDYPNWVIPMWRVKTHRGNIICTSTTRSEIEESGVQSREGSTPNPGAHTASYLTPTGWYFFGVKWPRHEARYWDTSASEVNPWNYIFHVPS
jgi:hypothetical protein